MVYALVVFKFDFNANVEENMGQTKNDGTSMRDFQFILTKN